uniref:Syndecan domain-containing protein n=1 Tax=Strongyloides venezuelensis TaxID=75913 RepID=A0A0K0EU97_STRVS
MLNIFYISFNIFIFLFFIKGEANISSSGEAITLNNGKLTTKWDNKGNPSTLGVDTNSLSNTTPGALENIYISSTVFQDISRTTNVPALDSNKVNANDSISLSTTSENLAERTTTKHFNNSPIIDENLSNNTIIINETKLSNETNSIFRGHGEVISNVAFITGILTLLFFIVVSCVIFYRFFHRNEVKQTPANNMMTLDEFN